MVLNTNPSFISSRCLFVPTPRGVKGLVHEISKEVDTSSSSILLSPGNPEEVSREDPSESVLTEPPDPSTVATSTHAHTTRRSDQHALWHSHFPFSISASMSCYSKRNEPVCECAGTISLCTVKMTGYLPPTDLRALLELLVFLLSVQPASASAPKRLR